MANKEFLNNIQLGRGVAALMVVFVHFHILPLQNAWASGVDFFFVLSGFIIFYVNEHNFSKPSKFWSYIYRRLLRIYPMYWLIIFSYLFIHYILGNSLKDFYQADTLGILKTLLLFPNHPLVVLTSWTLSYELIFYAIVAFRFLPKTSIIFYVFFLPSILAVFGYYFFWIPYFLYSPFLLEALLGIFIYWFYQKKRISIKKLYVYLILALVLLFTFPYLLTNHRFIARGIPTAILLFVLVGLEKKGKNKIPAFWIYLGNSSYILYLSHTIVLSTLTGLFDAISHYLLFKISLVLFVIIFSILVHYIIEKRLLLFLKNLPNRLKKYF